MPTYEYVCSSCANEWEEVQKISEPALEECPKCHNKTARRQISGGRFILKGGGWYADLYSSVKPGSGKKDETKSSTDAKTSGDSKSGGDAGASSGGSKDGGGSSSTPSTAPSTSSTSSSSGASSTPAK